jgi:ribosomal protein S18 acetylase RimI-like enzyme
MQPSGVRYLVRPFVENSELDALFSASWPAHSPSDWEPTLDTCMTYICAFDGEALIGFVKVAWDGEQHAFLLDPTVHPNYRRQGIGLELIRRAVEEAKIRGLDWMHVDYEPQLTELYRRAGFRPSSAAVLRLR